MVSVGISPPHANPRMRQELTRSKISAALNEHTRAAAEWRKGDTNQLHEKEHTQEKASTTIMKNGRRVGEKKARAAKGSAQQTSTSNWHYVTCQ